MLLLLIVLILFHKAKYSKQINVLQAENANMQQANSVLSRKIQQQTDEIDSLKQNIAAEISHADEQCKCLEDLCNLLQIG